MIFCGDIAVPYSKAIKIDGLPDSLAKQVWIGNLEGSLISKSQMNADNLQSKRIVFNSVEGINTLLKYIPFKAFSLANNHILDAAPLDETLNNLKYINISSFGAGLNLSEASKALFIKDDSVNYLIVSCGWDLIKCIYATNKSGGVNPYRCNELVSQAKQLVRNHPGCRIVFFLHWNYELELYPQPMDRGFAHALIDAGVYAVIGCHTHRVQPIEIYKGKPIVYGLGNFAFRQSTYMAGKLKFPEFSYPEIAFELKEDGSYTVHNFVYNPQEHIVSYEGVDTITQSNAIFASLNSKEYRSWFKKNRYQRKALPIFYYNDSLLLYLIKSSFVKARVKIVDILVKNQSLFRVVKKVMAIIFG